MRGHAKRIPEGMGRLPLMNTALRKPRHEELCRLTAAIGAILTADKIDREYKIHLRFCNPRGRNQMIPLLQMGEYTSVTWQGRVEEKTLSISSRPFSRPLYILTKL